MLFEGLRFDVTIPWLETAQQSASRALLISKWKMFTFTLWSALTITNRLPLAAAIISSILFSFAFAVLHRTKDQSGRYIRQRDQPAYFLHAIPLEKHGVKSSVLSTPSLSPIDHRDIGSSPPARSLLLVRLQAFCAGLRRSAPLRRMETADRLETDRQEMRGSAVLPWCVRSLSKVSRERNEREEERKQ